VKPTVPDSLLRADFNPLIRSYLLLQGVLLLTVTVVGIVLLPIWLVLGAWWAQRYFASLRCELDDDKLRFRKGILFQVEKTIPLENIQDVTFIEGPLLRRFNLSTLKFETAGSSGAQTGGADMQLTGIVGAADFRQQILARRNRLRRGAGAAAAGGNAELATLQRIATQLDEVLALLRKRDGG
jgi:membrane protein YdbS with pleckstrin-like domain